MDDSVEKAVRSGDAKAFAELRKLVEVYKHERHELSLGAALATLCAFDIVVNGWNRLNDGDETPIPMTVFAFSRPRVGNSEFKQSVVQLLPELKILHVTNSSLGIQLLGMRMWVWRFEPIQVSCCFLRILEMRVRWHNLDGYLHAVAGTQGMQGKWKGKVKGKGDGDFKVVVDRDISAL